MHLRSNSNALLILVFLLGRSIYIVSDTFAGEEAKIDIAVS